MTYKFIYASIYADMLHCQQYITTFSRDISNKEIYQIKRGILHKFQNNKIFQMSLDVKCH